MIKTKRKRQKNMLKNEYKNILKWKKYKKIYK